MNNMIKETTGLLFGTCRRCEQNMNKSAGYNFDKTQITL